MRNSRPKPLPTKPDQESVWAYPRPPRLEPSTALVQVRLGSILVAETRSAWRVLETSHPPTWYLPPGSVISQQLVRSGSPSTGCEWKGAATYWDVLGANGARLRAAAWTYERPTAPFAAITGYFAFRAGELSCSVNGIEVVPQPGDFYAGWITPDVVGPFKGEPGSWGW